MCVFRQEMKHALFVLWFLITYLPLNEFCLDTVQQLKRADKEVEEEEYVDVDALMEKLLPDLPALPHQHK